MGKLLNFPSRIIIGIGASDVRFKVDDQIPLYLSLKLLDWNVSNV